MPDSSSTSSPTLPLQAEFTLEKATRVARAYSWNEMKGLPAAVVLRIVALRAGISRPAAQIESETSLPTWALERLRKDLESWPAAVDLRLFLLSRRRRGKPREHDRDQLFEMFTRGATVIEVCKATGVSRSTAKRVRREWLGQAVTRSARIPTMKRNHQTVEAGTPNGL